MGYPGVIQTRVVTTVPTAGSVVNSSVGAAAAIAFSKLAALAAGSILVGVANVATELLKGTSRQYLRMNTGATAVEWGALMACLYFRKPVDAAAGTLAADAYIGVVPYAGTVDAVTFVPDTTLAAADTDTKTLALYKADGAGGAAVLVASFVSDVAGGGLTAAVKRSLTLSVVAGATTVVAGDVLYVAEAKAGNGAILPAGALYVHVG